MNLTEYCKESMSIGESVRHSRCPLCGVMRKKTKPFVVTRNKNGYVMFCHRCNKSRFVKSGGKQYVPPKSDVVKIVKNIIAPPVVDRTKEYVMLPRDTVSIIPVDPRMWLHKYSITDTEIETYNLGWSETYNRLILPVYNEEKVLVYWQGRYFGPNKNESKYLNIRSSKDDVFFITGSTDTNCIVLVEDIISAIAISRTGCRALALLGSNLPDYIVTYLEQQASLHENLQVIVWLDSDKRRSSIEYSNRLKCFGIKSTWVSTSLDPKCYTPEDIQTTLGME